jgi:hypothetical protein
MFELSRPGQRLIGKNAVQRYKRRFKSVPVLLGFTLQIISNKNTETGFTT